MTANSRWAGCMPCGRWRDSARSSEPICCGRLHDEAPGVREHAVLLAEPRLAKDSELLSAVLSAANDDDMRVRFQTALTLGEVDDPRAAAALGGILRRDLARSLDAGGRHERPTIGRPRRC